MIEFTAGTAIGGNIKINEFYTSEVEWLGSNGQATIATGTYPHDIWQVRFTFSYSKWAQYGNVFYSTYEGESRRYLRLILYSSDSNKGYFNYKSGTALSTPTLNKNTQYDITMNSSNIIVNGTKYTTPTLSGTDTNGEVVMFCSNKNGYARDIGCKIYSFKIWNTSQVLVRDYIPVRFRNNSNQYEGALFDKVTKQLFKNAGTAGAFTYGNDVAS